MSGAAMVMNISIKADIDNISLSGLFKLMSKHQLEKPEGSKDCVIEYDGMKFRVVTTINMGIEYVVTEIREEKTNG